jgi:hypothetical protein
MPAIWFYPGTPGFINLTPGIYMPFFFIKKLHRSSFVQQITNDANCGRVPQAKVEKKLNFVKEN